MSFDPTETASIPSVCAAFNVRRASRAVTRFYAKALESADLEPTQFALLVACSQQESECVSRLAVRLSMELSALGRNVSVLERRKLLATKHGKDRRTRRVSITVAGRNVLKKALPLWRSGQTTLEAEFGRAPMHALIAGLQAITRTTQKLLDQSD